MTQEEQIQEHLNLFKRMGLDVMVAADISDMLISGEGVIDPEDLFNRYGNLLTPEQYYFWEEFFKTK